MGTICCWVLARSLSSSFLSWFWCWWLLGLSVSSRRSPRLRQWLHPRWCGGHVWKHGQQFRSSHQTSSLPVCYLKNAFQCLTCLIYVNFDKVLTRNFIHNPFLLSAGTGFFTFISVCLIVLNGLKTTFSLVGPMVCSIFSDTPFTYGRHKICTLLLSVSLSFTVSSCSLSLSSSFWSLVPWSPSFLTVTSFFLSPFPFGPFFLRIG